MQSSLRQKLDHARGAGPDETTLGEDRGEPESEALHHASLNGANGHPAPDLEVSTPVLAPADVVLH